MGGKISRYFNKRDFLSDAADIVTIGSAFGDDNNNEATCCQPCCSDSHDEQSRDKIDCSTDDKLRSDATKSESATIMLDEIRTDIGHLKNHFVSDTPESAANNQVSKIASEMTAANSTLNQIHADVNLLADHFTRDVNDKSGNDKPQPNWSLMLLGNIAIDVKRMADQYVGEKLNPSTKDPIFQNIRDTAWLNNTLNGIQDNTSRTATLLPIQPNNYFNQTNNFSISGAQEPRAVAEAVRDSMPMLSDFSQANQILQARAL